MKEEILKIIENHQGTLPARNPGSFYTAVNFDKYEALATDLEAYCKTLQSSTGIKDMHGNEIMFGQTLRFTNKWEWYRATYGPRVMLARDEQEKQAIMNEFHKEPEVIRVVESIQDYAWLLSDEVQQYWEIVEPKQGKCSQPSCLPHETGCNVEGEFNIEDCKYYTKPSEG